MASRDVIHEAVLQLRADTTQLRSDLAAGRGMFEGSLKGMQGLARSLVPVLSIGGIVALGKNLLDLGDQLSDLHDKTGLSIEVLGGLKPMIDQTDSSIDQFATGILKAQKNLGGIKSAADPAALALKSMGLNLQEMMSATPDEFLEKFAKGLATVEDRNKRAALATQILGKAGADLNPILLKIAEQGLTRLSENAAAGFKALGKLKDRMTNLIGVSANFMAGLLGSGLGGQIKTLDGQIAGLTQRMEKLQDSSDGAIQKLHGQLKAQRDALIAARDALKGPLAETTPPEGTDTGGPDAQKIQSATESLQKQIAALHAQKIELEQGEQAGLRYRISQQLMADLGIKRLPPELERLIEKLVGESKALAIAKFQSDRLDESTKRLDQDLGELGKAVQETWELITKPKLDKETALEDALRARIGAMFDQDSAEIAAGHQEIEKLLNEPFKIGDALTVRLREISLEAQLFGSSFDTTAEKINAVQSAMKGLIEVMAKGLPGAADAGVELQQLKTQLDGLKNLQAVESSFDSLLNGITQSLAGARMGTQSFAEALKNTLANVFSSLSENMLKAGLEPLKKQLSGFLQSSFPSIFGTGGLLGGVAGAGKDIALTANTAALNALTVALGGAGASGAALGGLFGGGSGVADPGQFLGSPVIGEGFEGLGGGFDLSKIFSGITEKLSSMMSGLMDTLSSMMGGMGDMFSSLFSSIGGFIMGLFDKGGFVGLGGLPSFAAGGAVPIMAHPGELVLSNPQVRSLGQGSVLQKNMPGRPPQNASGSNVRVQINGDIIPRTPGMTPDQVIKVFVNDYKQIGGQTRQVINSDRGGRR